MKTSLTSLAVALATATPALAQDTAEGWTPDIIVTGTRLGYDEAAAVTATRTATPPAASANAGGASYLATSTPAARARR